MHYKSYLNLYGGVEFNGATLALTNVPRFDIRMRDADQLRGFFATAISDLGLEYTIYWPSVESETTGNESGLWGLYRVFSY